jgi:hypothetical protein
MFFHLFCFSPVHLPRWQKLHPAISPLSELGSSLFCVIVPKSPHHNTRVHLQWGVYPINSPGGIEHGWSSKVFTPCFREMNCNRCPGYSTAGDDSVTSNIAL